jgi:hypothetical protein
MFDHSDLQPHCDAFSLSANIDEIKEPTVGSTGAKYSTSGRNKGGRLATPPCTAWRVSVSYQPGVTSGWKEQGYAHLSKGTFPNDPMKIKVVQVNLAFEINRSG